MNRRAFLMAALLALMCLAPGRYSPARAASDLEVIYVGGWDCPPCAVWKKTRKAAWIASPEYRQVTWVEIESPRLRDAYKDRYWPLELKPVLAKLPHKSGTPRFLIVSKGRLVFNAAGADQWERTLRALRNVLG